jgi:membrane protease YdiL (CAAX protease family)
LTGPGADGHSPDHEPSPGPTSAPESTSAAQAASTTGADDLPGGGIFTLQGRRAPGLYLVAWILTIGGLVVTFVLGPMASDPGWRPMLILLGALAVTLGLAAGAGSQVLERADRDPERYHGPSPLLVFGVYFFALSSVGLVLLTVLGVDPERPLSFLAIGIAQGAGYLLVVWLFACRSGALTWPQMGWPTWNGSALREVAGSIGLAVTVMLPVTIALLFVGGLVGLLLGTDAPQTLPLSETFADGVFVVLAAAIIVPIGEELFFRGFAQIAWTRDLGPRTALLRATVFFGVVHVANVDAVTFGQGLAQAALTLVVILPVAYVLGWLFQQRGLAAAMSGHITYNSLLLMLAFLASKIPEPAGL